MEVIKPFDDIIACGPFMGFEVNPCPDCLSGAVNPGLGLGAPAKMNLYRAVLNYYSQLTFLQPDGSYNMTDAVVNITTRELVKQGLKDEAGIQTVDGITIYPMDYFNPLDDATGRLCKTANTRSIHWFTKTWMNISPWRQKISRLAHQMFGVNTFSKFRKFFK